MEKTFKVLMVGNIIIDESQLRLGIYETGVPTLHSQWETIEGLIEKWEFFKEVIGKTTVGGVISNLGKCELKEVKLIIPD
jgi:hypothetical protein